MFSAYLTYYYLFFFLPFVSFVFLGWGWFFIGGGLFYFLGFFSALVACAPHLRAWSRLPRGLPPKEAEVELVGLRGRCLNLTVGRSTTFSPPPPPRLHQNHPPREPRGCETLEKRLLPGWGEAGTSRGCKLGLKLRCFSTPSPRLTWGAIFTGGPRTAL